MPLNINLPTSRQDGDAGHTAGHNATNTAVNSTAAAVDALAAVATSGSASDITTGTLPDGVIPAGIARDTEVATAVSTAVAALVASAPSTLDTLDELAAALGDDPSFATTTATALGNRLRVDTAAQGLNGTQQGNARTNLALGGAATLSVGTGTGTVAAGDDARFTGAVTAARMPYVLGTVTATTGVSGTVSTDASTGGNLRNITATGNVTLSAPTNPSDGQILQFTILASGGARTVDFGTGVLLLTGVSTSYAPASGKVLRLAMRYTALLSAWIVEAAAVSL